MQYFNTLPLISTIDPQGNSIIVNNIMARAYILPISLSNPILNYSYDLKEIDTPENIAYKYYGDPYRYWTILYANNVLDPQTALPLSKNNFETCLIDKYKSSAASYFNVSVSDVTPTQVIQYTQLNVHHYEKTISTTNSIVLGQIVNTTVYIDSDQYNSTNTYSKSITFGDGSTSTVSLNKQIVSIYDYELKLNENKRTINIIKSDYIGSAESQLQSLMSQ